MNPVQSLCLGLLAVALGAPAMRIGAVDDLPIPSATMAVEPVQAISPPDLRLQQDPPEDIQLAYVQAPCRDYADSPSMQPDTPFAECWNEKKTAWERTKPSAIGLSLPQLNTSLSSDALNGGAPRETPVP